MINENVRRVIESELESGENILWAGSPDPKLQVTSFIMPVLGAAFIWLLFGTIIMATFMGFWEAFQSGDQSSFIAGLIIFSVFSLFLLFILYVHFRHALLGKFENYFITNKRIIIKENLWPKKVFSLTFAEIHKVKSQKSTLQILANTKGFYSLISRNGQVALMGFNPDVKSYFLRRLQDSESVMTLIQTNRSKTKDETHE